jgi:hypothetical protein
VERLRSAIIANDLRLLEPALSEDIQFGPCVGRLQVLQHLQQAVDLSGFASVEIDSREDRLLVTPEPKSRDSIESTIGTGPHVAVFFVQEQKVVELQVAGNLQQATEATATPRLKTWSGTRARLTGLAAVLPVRNLARALEHYRMLGFVVRAYSGGGYGYAERDSMNLHFSVVSDLEPSRTTSAIYLYVDDADALFAEWRASGASGQFFEPEQTEYGMREGAHVDLDGNLLRFGSASAGR